MIKRHQFYRCVIPKSNLLFKALQVDSKKINPHARLTINKKKSPQTKHPLLQSFLNLNVLGIWGYILLLNHHHLGVSLTMICQLPIQVTHFPHQTSVRNHSGPGDGGNGCFSGALEPMETHKKKMDRVVEDE